MLSTSKICTKLGQVRPPKPYVNLGDSGLLLSLWSAWVALAPDGANHAVVCGIDAFIHKT